MYNLSENNYCPAFNIFGPLCVMTDEEDTGDEYTVTSVSDRAEGTSFL